MKKGVRYGTVFFLVVATAFITAIATYYYLSMIVNDLGKNQQMYLKLDKVNQIISQNYINTIEPLKGYDKITDGIISGYIEGLGDPYSYYLDEKDYQASTVSLDASAVSIGIRYSYDSDSGGIRVDFAKYGSPAKLAGIKTGDVILSIDGTDVDKDGYRKSVQRLSGETDSIVDLKVMRPGELEPRYFSVRRTAFESQTVHYRMTTSEIGYIAINEFDKSTLNDFTVAYDDLISKGVKGFIFDVRNTNSGDLNYAVEVLDKIMPVGIIVSTKEKSSSDPSLYMSDDKHILSVPMAVLQNGQTAALGEVFAAALKDTELAFTVGTTTKGVGVGQRDIPLSDGTAIRLSTFEYIPPSGIRFNTTGLEPTYVSELDAEKTGRFEQLTDEEDDQLQAAVENLKETMGLQ